MAQWWHIIGIKSRVLCANMALECPAAVVASQWMPEPDCH